MSVEALEAVERERYVELAVFPEDASIPIAAVEALWSVSGDSALDSRDRIRHLEARSLVRRDEDARLRLHDLQVDYVQLQAGDLAPLHARLIEGYGSLCGGDFASGLDDGYFFERLGHHLVGAGLREQLRELLADFRWLAAKLRGTSVPALLADFDELEADDPMWRVQEALRRSADVLALATEQLRSVSG